MNTLAWKESFQALGRALDRLSEGLQEPQLETNQLMQDGLIQRFEFTMEQFWKVLKKILQAEGIETIGPRDVFKKAFQYNLIEDEEAWLIMLRDRNQTSHTYEQHAVAVIFKDIKKYFPVMRASYNRLQERYKNVL